MREIWIRNVISNDGQNFITTRKSFLKKTFISGTGFFLLEMLGLPTWHPTPPIYKYHREDANEGRVCFPERHIQEKSEIFQFPFMNPLVPAHPNQLHRLKSG